MSSFSSFGKLVATCVAAGVVVAGSMFPLAGAAGLASNKMADSLAGTSADLIKGDLPSITTVEDVEGEPIAWLYDQQRIEVPSNEISQPMKEAIISVEDRRFTEHNGVDWRGTVRAAVTNFTSGDIEQGASTLTQQLVKNYQFLVAADNDAERRAAIETTPARKIQEIRIALTLDEEMSKDDILTKYLNLISFGHGAFGVQVAAQTYFGIDASELNVPQSAMLAGMIQSTSAFDPYAQEEATRDRRNTVIDTMVETGAVTPAEGESHKQEPLGVLPAPQSIPTGCLTAGDRGFYCDYVLSYLDANGLRRDIVGQGGYTIRTSLDQEVQENVQRALDNYGQPQSPGVAEVMSVVRPGHEAHEVVAVASSREYGLDLAGHETVQPQPYSLVGDGSGSVNKIFTVAAAMEQGMGISTDLPVPNRVEVTGMGAGGAAGCPPNAYCVENAGSYPSSLSVTDALAQSPNTTFVNLIEQVGVPETVDMAVRLGLRSYSDTGHAPDGDSIANYVTRNNLGSFTLGPNALNALEMSNVGATLASDGVWCPPSPVQSITDAEGRDVTLNEPACEQVVEPGLANTLLNAMSEDHLPGGTAANAAGSIGWNLPMSGKTGTTESNRSAAFLGVTNEYAASTYAFNDGTETTALCTTPLRQCGSGTLFGGNEPAQTWYSAMLPIAEKYGPLNTPSADPSYVSGTTSGSLPDVVGMSRSQATSVLRDAGYQVDVQMTPDSSAEYGTVVSTSSLVGTPGSTVTISVADGSGTGGGQSGTNSGGAADGAVGTGDDPVIIEVPGLPPVTITPPG